MLHEWSHDGRDLDALIALPQGDGPHPAVLICHAWGGRKAFEEDRARDLARLGYAGVAIDLYGVGRRGNDQATSSSLMNELVGDPDLFRARLRRTVEEIAGLEAIDAGRIGAIGYCFGGLAAILMGRLGLPLRAICSFHGLLKLGQPTDGPFAAKLLVQHGQDDPMVSADDLAAFAAEMKRLDADWTLHAYPGVMHTFTNPMANDPDFGTVYDAHAAKRSWTELERFLSDHL